MEEDDCARTEASSSRAITKTRDIHTDSFLTGAREVVLRVGGWRIILCYCRQRNMILNRNYEFDDNNKETEIQIAFSLSLITYSFVESLQFFTFELRVGPC